MSDNWSRRGLLTVTGTVGAVALTPTVLARYTVRMVIPRVREFDKEGYTGFFLHVGRERDDRLSVDAVEGCKFANWPPGEIAAYDGRLIDRIDKSHREVPTQIYVSADRTVETGSLWVINREISCPKENVGLEAEQLGASIRGNQSATETETKGGSGPIGQPGFSALSAGTALLAGAAALARRLDTDE